MCDLDELFMHAFRSVFMSIGDVAEFVAPLAAHSANSFASVRKSIAARNSELVAAERALDNLHILVKDGLGKASDPDFKARFSEVKADGDRLRRERDQLTAKLEPSVRVDHEKITEFIDAISRAFDATDVSVRKSYLRTLIDEIVVGDDCITIIGRRSMFEQAIETGRRPPPRCPLLFVSGGASRRMRTSLQAGRGAAPFFTASCVSSRGKACGSSQRQ